MSSNLEAIATPHAPAAIGPYAQAVAFGDLVFCSGQVGFDPATGDVVDGDIQAETRQVLANLDAVLRVANTGFEAVLKVTVYLADMADFAAVNEVYAEAFGESQPARACVEASRLPRDVRIEMDCIAAR